MAMSFYNYGRYVRQRYRVNLVMRTVQNYLNHVIVGPRRVVDRDGYRLLRNFGHLRLHLRRRGGVVD